ncbi:ankyrin repeat-containing protein NPR4-like [Eucalyptus grandis]|uniref:ankyrin repeat-containing protein NPR4-like n=1 Tax=Eucalyptus grandis TaxID=71139 RepID=UPI00192F0FA8|nr:ankyrin repeat-containing protein NPR4-like [Eucalyptus grandis]
MRSAIREKEQEMKMKEDGKPSPKDMDPSMYKAAKEGNFTALENSIRKYGEDEPRLDPLKLETRKGNSLVHLAAESGHEDFIKQVLRKCPQLVAKPNNSCRECAQLVDKPDKSCCGADTPLHIAARTRPFKVMETILSEAKLREGKATTETPCTQKMKEMENGGTARIITSLLSKTNGAGNTALHEALRNGNEKMGMLLWSEDEEMVGSVNKAGESALYVAAELGIEKVVKEMVKFLESGRQCEEGVRDRALRGPEGQNPLHAAVLAGSRNCVEALINLQGSDMINKADDNGRTALHFAAKAGEKDIATRLLLTDPSSAYTKERTHGRTPLLEAASSGHLHVLREILEHCPDTVEVADDEGRNVVHLALKCGPKHSKAVLRLPELVRLVNEVDRFGNTPLHVAAGDLNYRMVKRLLKIPGVNLRAKNDEGCTFLDICESEWQYTKRKCLLTGTSYPSGLAKSLRQARSRPQGHANALCVVATLLATITFAAAFTLPGGLTPEDIDTLPPLPSPLYNFHDSPQHPPPAKLSGQKNHKPGHPILIDQTAFKVFILADVLAVSTSLTVLFLLISAMLAEEMALRRAIVYSKKLLYISLGGTMVAFVTGLYSVISTDVVWLEFAVGVIGSSIPFLIKYFQVKSFTSTPVCLHRLLSKKSTKKPWSVSCNGKVHNNSESSDKTSSVDDEIKRTVPPRLSLGPHCKRFSS